ncbi:MAG: hypothetical protein GF411_12935 [Candidatus Lokiarchaeota archaeon]|nr:hypothetical protein [Candidatus Lokiarchaeota archaeon]
MIENGTKIIEQYLEFVKSHLPDEIADDVIDELRVYLVEAATDLGNGELTEKSAKKAVARFGAPSEVAKEYRDSFDFEEPIRSQYPTSEELTRKTDHEIELQELRKTQEYEEKNYHSHLSLLGKAILGLIAVLSITAFPFYFQFLILGFTIAELIMAIFIIFSVVLVSKLKNTQYIVEDNRYRTSLQILFSFPNGLLKLTPRILAVDIIFSLFGIFMAVSFLSSHNFYIFGLLLIVLLSYRIIFDISRERFDMSENAKKSVILDGIIIFVIHIFHSMIVPPHSLYSKVNIFFPFFGVVYSSFTLVMLLYKIQTIWIDSEKDDHEELDIDKVDTLDMEHTPASDFRETEIIKEHRKQQIPRTDMGYIQTLGRSIGWIFLFGLFSALTTNFVSLSLGIVEGTSGFFISMVVIQVIISVIFSCLVLIYHLEKKTVPWKILEQSSLKEMTLMPKGIYSFENRIGLYLDLMVSTVLLIVSGLFLIIFNNSTSIFLVVVILVISLAIRLKSTVELLSDKKESSSSKDWLADTLCYLLLLSLIGYLEQFVYYNSETQFNLLIRGSLNWFILCFIVLGAYLLLRISTTMHRLWFTTDPKGDGEPITSKQKAKLVLETQNKSNVAVKGYTIFVLGLEIIRIVLIYLTQHYNIFILYTIASPYVIGSITFWIVGSIIIKRYFGYRKKRIESGDTRHIFGVRSRIESLSDLVITGVFLVSTGYMLSGSWIHDILMIANVEFSELFILVISIVILLIALTSRIIADFIGLINPDSAQQHWLLYISYAMFFIFGTINSILFATNTTPNPMNLFWMFIHLSVVLFCTFQIPICVLGIITFLRIRNLGIETTKSVRSSETQPVEGPAIKASESFI